MERITGTLKFFGPTKDGKKATLTADWSNGEKRLWVTWEEAQPLREARLVYEHPVEKWDDGKAKWMVNGTPEITLEVTGTGRSPTTKVCVNGAEPTGTDAVPHVSGLTERAAYFSECMKAAANLWNDNVTDDVLYKTAFTLYKS